MNTQYGLYSDIPIINDNIAHNDLAGETYTLFNNLLFIYNK